MKKLVLRKETVRELSAASVEAVVAGGVQITTTAQRTHHLPCNPDITMMANHCRPDYSFIFTGCTR